MKIRWIASYSLHIDVLFLLGILLLSTYGLIVLYSASGESTDMILRQSMRFGIGLILMILLAQFNPEQIMRWVPWLYSIGILMLIAVFVMGDIGKGAQRWLDLGIVRFQPSEFMKLIVPMTISLYLSERPLPPSYLHIATALVLLMLPTLLIAKQPDLGTALLIASSGSFTLLLAGINWKLVVGTLVGGVSVALLVAFTPLNEYLLHGYQMRRIETFLDPEKDPLGAGYHIIQSTIAIGSGGLYGKGWLQGTQSHLEFIPERHTDFIFAVLSEEFGLIGVIVLLSLYFFILTRGLFIAINAQGSFARLLAGSITLTFFVYVFVNIGMVTGLLPVVGVPLPLISYGGTAVVSLFAGFGLLMGVHTHKRLLSG